MPYAETVAKLQIFWPPTDEVLVEADFGRPADADIAAEAHPPRVRRIGPFLSSLPFKFLALPTFLIHKGTAFEESDYLLNWPRRQLLVIWKLPAPLSISRNHHLRQRMNFDMLPQGV